MTIQIPDTVVYSGKKYELVWDNFLEQLIHKRFNIENYINGSTTSCYRGYVSQYSIRTACLYLTQFEVFAMKEPFLEIGGRKPIRRLYKSSRAARKRGAAENVDSGWVDYGELNERIEGTGYLLIASGYTGEVYFPTLYPHRCHKLIGITIKNGQPKFVEDFSKEALQIRETLDLGQYPTQEEHNTTEAFRNKVIKTVK